MGSKDLGLHMADGAPVECSAWLGFTGLKECSLL